MDPADLALQAKARRRVFFEFHTRLLRGLSENSRSLTAHLAALTQQVSQLATLAKKVTANLNQSTSFQTLQQQRNVHVSDPEPFSGDMEKCQVLLIQCGLIVQQHQCLLASDESKIRYTIRLEGQSVSVGQSAKLRIGL